MVYAILLDDYQPGSGDYAVSHHGSLADCRACTTDDGHIETWARGDYDEVSSEPKSLSDPHGTERTGRIAGLDIRRAFAARTVAPAPPPAPAPAPAPTGLAPFLAGIAVGLVAGLIIRRAR